ncbi:hypothetical protein N7510_007784 [Penicillium lagena]|uniref:uncharacterized protein n=1 Tax=Penicillium lagena TaxID=94218 RepID=UPI0025405F75|nr:uncharacterized protein N7510_007784 [Penicillium lagena]KAJ5611065.1 hypothetical protein N7510_007784 [Penicillium lagena]
MEATDSSRSGDGSMGKSQQHFRGDNCQANQDGFSFQRPASSSQLPDGEYLNDHLGWVGSFGAAELHSSVAHLYGAMQPGMDPSIVNWMSPENQQVMDWDRQLTSFTVHIGEATSGHGGFPFYFNEPNPVNITGDQWNLASARSQEQSEHLLQRTSRDASENSLSGPSESYIATGSMISTSTDGNLYVDGSGARAPFGGRLNIQCSPLSVDANGEDVTELAPSHSATAGMVSMSAYQGLRDHLEDESCLHSQSLDLSQFPPYAHIQGFVRYYFERFHLVFPFLRMSSFSHDSSHHWVLLLAVAATGSRYLRRNQGIQPGDMLLGLLRTILSRRLFGLQVDNDESIPFIPGAHTVGSTIPDLPVLQAAILSVMCTIHSGTKSMAERAFVERHYLVEACIASGLLSATAPAEALSDGTVNDDTFRRWLYRESEIRTGMMIWLLDSIIAYQFGVKPLMHLEDVNAPLPSREDIWEAPSIAKSMPTKLNMMTLPESVLMLYMEKKLPPNLGEFSTALLINAIYRRTNDAISQERSALNSWVPTATRQRRTDPATINESWPPSSQLSSKWRNSACDSLDVLHWSANSKTMRLNGVEHPTILHLHLARLIILTPTVHIQAFATHSSSPQTGHGSENKIYITARNQVLQWVGRDQFKARLSVIHCGALFWHVRRHSLDSVMEPFAIYIATLVLWAFCVSFQFAGRNAYEGHVSQQDSSEQPLYELPEPPFILLDRPLDDELVQLFVRMGHRMNGYITRVGNIQDPEAPRKLLQEGIRLLNRDHGSGFPLGDDRQSHRSRTGEPLCHTWGIEASFIEVLSRLVRATVELVSNQS